MFYSEKTQSILFVGVAIDDAEQIATASTHLVESRNEHPKCC